MSRHEIGIDLIDIDRIHAVLGKFPDRFRLRVLTEHEQRYCGNKVERIAGRWAAKEAISSGTHLSMRLLGMSLQTRKFPSPNQTGPSAQRQPS